jgi:phosphohistidine phosphatase SixA
MFQAAGVTAVFTSDARRTKETAGPLAARVHVTPEELPGLDATVHRDRVRAVNGGIVVVVGHTNTVPPLITALDVVAHVEIGADQFDRLFIVIPGATGGAQLLSLRY